ncbi:2-C-methyl-D-erythritol 4-phosphate cytidylyltransferase [Dechloromonas sp.]|uniref:2-C-methyl-D-erythritol 4-phosphate cytidylyltransferase n=1 Tax=Dechloromonas sp. TaxID=1917218 RepID=UPI0011FBE57E|nr:2-C-methyl-D-erythritol 4-phosphate cytidylyltransferase [Dechloromonas sp.]MBU3697348.1 2-C-methyl-D-erythritol 4-phosphate cytidylyltransferase [Dechloromonas sp.]TEX49073.1 MAG: 2-C-methyl-D-erythritol 4-phosphate cytidylyltransferase [Rhodocyclaceae bacterium]
MPRHFAIVPAAGSGARFGAEKPKQYLDLLGRPLIYHTLAVLTACPDIERVWVVLSPDDRDWGQHDWSELGPKLETLRCGGTTRAESVTNGLQAAAMVATDDDWVLVHDAARPCLSLAMLDALFSELADDPVGGLLAVPVADTIKRADGEQRVVATEPRDGLWQAQTPQMFRYGQLKKALEMTSNVTDEAGAIEAAGIQPRLVKADSTNLKVTYPADLALAAMILRARK